MAFLKELLAALKCDTAVCWINHFKLQGYFPDDLPTVSSLKKIDNNPTRCIVS